MHNPLLGSPFFNFIPDCPHPPSPASRRLSEIERPVEHSGVGRDLGMWAGDTNKPNAAQATADPELIPELSSLAGPAACPGGGVRLLMRRRKRKASLNARR